jgi:hypothetical protein
MTDQSKNVSVSATVSKPISRRDFLHTAARASTASAILAAGFPTIVPASVFGETAPSNRINIGAIGTGRISRVHDLPGIWKYDGARIMALCDLDSNRVADAKTLINGYYSQKTGKLYDGVTGYANYHELLANKDIDAVVISTPDHKSDDQHGNWLDCIRSRQQPISPAELGHRACSTCLVHHIVMKLKRKVYWDPLTERFHNDDEANSMLARAQRSPYTLAAYSLSSSKETA